MNKMGLKIVVAPNAFKGSLTAREASQAMKKGILAADPFLNVVCMPVSDGGDGLVQVIQEALGGEFFHTRVSDPLMRPISARFCLVSSQALAVLEMAEASGLALIEKSLQDPTQTTTFGTGELIKAAIDKGARQIILGIGGSATCDGGMGTAAALGYEFLDKNNGRLEPVGASLGSVVRIDSTRVDPRIKDISFLVACDVTNPLTGKTGAAQVFAPQKGASPDQVRSLDQGLAHFSQIICTQLGIDMAHLPGAGAAGGLGGGMHAFFNAKLVPGIDLVLDLLEFQRKLDSVDLVLTGEGRVDRQTRFNKAPAGVARAAAAAKIPCMVICGSMEREMPPLPGMEAIFSICSHPMDLKTAMENAFDLLASTTEQVVRAFCRGRLSVKQDLL